MGHNNRFCAPKYWGGKEDRIFGISWNPDGTQLATVGDEKVKIYDVESGSLLKEFEIGAGEIEWSPDGTKFALANNTWRRSIGRYKNRRYPPVVQ